MHIKASKELAFPQWDDGPSPVERVLDHLEAYAECGDGFRARCPAHNGNSANSLSIKEGDDGRALLFCHSGCELQKIVDALGLGMADLFARNGRSEAPTAKKATRKTDDEKVLTTDELPAGKYYEFTSPAGEVLYIQRHKGAYYRKVGEGLWRKGLKGVSQVLYNLHELVDGVRTGKTIYHLEGCKDVQTAREKLGVVATTSGDANSWRPEFKALYAGADVVVVADNDKEGRSYAEEVAGDLLTVARSVKVVNLPGLDNKGDLTDWLNKGHTKEEFFAVVGNSANSANYANRNGDEKIAVEPWSPPAAFHSVALPEFPREVYPEWLEQYADGVAEATQTPRGLPHMLALPVGATASAKVVEVEVWDGWREPLTLTLPQP
jgi:hypothetical protein